MASARLVDHIPGPPSRPPDPVTLPAPAERRSYLIYEAEGTAEELDGAKFVVPAFISALGPLNIAVADAQRLGRIAAAVARALDPASPGGRRMTLGEIAELAGVALG